MVATNRVSEIFADARKLYAGAIERLGAGDIRDAAEKAWPATFRATNALILARTEDEPQKSPATSRELKQLASKDEAIRPLVERYYAFQAELHGECFYLGFCDPEEETGRRIRATEQFIRDVEALAGQ